MLFWCTGNADIETETKNEFYCSVDLSSKSDVVFTAAISRCYSGVRFASYDATRTNMFIDKSTKVICQGFTGKQVRYH